jgi:hypothetical protein
LNEYDCLLRKMGIDLGRSVYIGNLQSLKPLKKIEHTTGKSSFVEWRSGIERVDVVAFSS